MQDWDINKPSAAPGTFDILVARHLSADAQDLPGVLALAYNLITEGGFIMLQELVGPLGTAVFGLPQHRLSDGRKHGLCTSLEHWRAMLADTGFAEVRTLG